MYAVTKAIATAPLFYHHLQAELLSSSGQNYKTTLYLSSEAREELWWWTTHLRNWNGRSLIAKMPLERGRVLSARESEQGVPGQRGANIPYQLLRTAGSVPCIQILLQRQEEYSCPTENGQHFSDSLHQQDGGMVPQP